MIERQTARKVRAAALTGGEWVKKEGMEPSYIVTSYGENVARARVMGTIVGKFVAEDEQFASVTLDDSTDTIRAKVFKGVKPLDSVQVGELVDIVGKVREWNGEIYIIPEVVCKVEDPNLELLRRVEVAKKVRGADPNELEKGREEKEDLRQLVLGIIEGEKDGIPYEGLVKKTNKPEGEVEKVINDLLAEGICYEPNPGKIKKI